MLLEGTIFIAGILLYNSVTRARDETGNYGFWSLMVLLALLWVGSILGPPPPTMTVVEVAGLAGAIVIFVWAGWVDKHRVARS
jgi:hypothetical protein